MQNPPAEPLGSTFSFDDLRRYPDVEAANLFASDAADRLILDTAALALAASARGETIVIGDHYGALALGAAAVHGVRGLRVHQDALAGERALANNASGLGLAGAYVSLDLGAELLEGARIVLLHLPRSLDALDEIAEAIARFAAADVAIYAGGMVKHLTIAMNDVLGRHFGEVRAGLARQKARVLTVSSVGRVTSANPTWPRHEFHSDLDLWVCAHGAAFAGTKIDIGTRLLLEVLAQARPDAVSAIDLGCGTGVIAAALAKARPGIAVLATDQSAGAVASARATMTANGLADRVTVVRDDALSARPNASAELILLNPPFHIGAAVHAGAALKLFEDAARVLEPGGELWTVWNSHLAYKAALSRLVGPTRQVARNAKFTVTASTRR
ncbi:MAG: rRNA (guanine1207-N2)-methyltransferase [Microbacteriaceae bacterium]|jgi:16S rRNA (guanine1207-N2)-methyltransferase|nr:rRNA (guanine1207-N2)-methyltransferase [Microbacteriaceae bacterium]